jgi:hypothetical protein
MVREKLVREFGFDPEYVIELYDDQATRENILKAFDKLMDPRKVSPDDRVLFFFAGHGMTRTVGGKDKGYIMPVDGVVGKFASTAISTDQLHEFQEAIPAKHVFFAMDACYSGTIFTRGIGLRQPTYADISEALKRYGAKRVRVAITAGSKDEQVTDLADKGLSVFTYYFLKGLDGDADVNGDGIITSSELADYVARNVKFRAPQTPQYGRLPGDEGGEFVFMRVSTPVTAQPPVQPARPAEIVREIPVIISSEPIGATVKLNGRIVGNTPVTLNLKPGTAYAIELEKEGYVSIAKDLIPRADQKEPIKFELEPVVATLDLTTEPEGAIVIIDGAQVGRTPLLYDVEYGKHRISVTKEGYEPYEFEIDVKSKTEIKRMITLRETPEMMARRIYRARLRSKRFWMWTNLLLSAGAGAGAFVMYGKANKLYDEYLSATTPSEIEAKWQEYDKTIKQTYIIGGVAGGFAILAVYFMLKGVSYEDIYWEIKKKEVSLNFINTGEFRGIQISFKGEVIYRYVKIFSPHIFSRWKLIITSS